MLKIKSRKKLIIPVAVVLLLVISTSSALAYGYSHAKVVGGNYESTGDYFLNNTFGWCNWNGYNSNDSDKDIYIGIKTGSGNIYQSQQLVNDNVRRYYREVIINGAYYAAYVKPRPQWDSYWADCWVHEVEPD